MSSLVADYGSDITDSDDDVATTDSQPAVVENHQSAFDTKNDNLLMAGDASDSDDSESDEDDEPETDPTPVPRLPNPLVGIFPSADEDKSKIQVHNSVFSSEYDTVEAAKRSVLEKHVKMTDEELEQKRKRPICQKFKDGKCRFGAKCKFSHDLKKGRQDQQQSAPASTPPPIPNVFNPRFLTGPRSLEIVPEPEDDDSYMAQAKRKRRHGIRDTLVPPKRALNDLNKQRRQERPWTDGAGPS